MKLSLVSNGLLIEPETDFEAQYLLSIDTKHITLFHKTGTSPSYYLGLKLLVEEKKDDKQS